MSNINANNIDGTFPVAGVDNDSQGFRTNFTNIKNNFSYAKTEITDLQDKAILKSALTNGTLDNNMAGAVLSSAQIKDFRETEYDLTSVSGSVVISHANGHYQIMTTTGSVSISFSNLPPAGTIGRIKLEVTVTDVGHSLTLPATVSLGTQGIAGFDGTNTIYFSETGTYIFEFTTDDAGTTIHINDLTRPRDYFYSDHITLVGRQITDARGEAGDMEGMIVADTTTPALWLCTGSYDGTTIIWRKAELESPSNESATTSNTYITSGTLTTTGLSFVGNPNVRYRFDAYIPFSHNLSATAVHKFDVSFTGGDCVALIEQQASPTGAMNATTVTTSESAASSVTTTSTSTKFCRISGTYRASAGPVSQRTLTIKAATSGGVSPNLNVQAGSYIRFNRV